LSKTKLLSLNNYDVYFVIDDDLTYYMSMPNNDNDSFITMTIALSSDSDILNSNITSLKDSIKSLYKDFDNTSSVLIVPCVDKKTYFNLNDISNIEIFNKTGKYVTNIVNSSYKIIKEKVEKIDTNINFLKEDLEFIDWFCEKYYGRIKKIDIINLLEKYLNENNKDLKKVNVNGVNFIVGNNNINEEEDDLKKIEIPYESYSDLYKDEGIKKRDFSYAAGNISYYFIGTLVVITSLIILVLLIKR